MFVYSKMQINFQSKTVLLSLLFIILPNIFFWLVGWYLNLSRPLINLDYILPIALRLPANLLQAQRDYFGAHTYERIDQPRGAFFHTNWTGTGGDTASTTYDV